MPPSSQFPWRTALSKVEPNKVFIRGYDVRELAGNVSFWDVVHLLWKGELPKGNEGKMIEAIFVIVADFSLCAPSTDALRYVSSCGVPLQASVAAAINSMGELHGGAVEQCCKMLQEGIDQAKKLKLSLDEMAERIIRVHKEEDRRIIGFGHPIHSEDSRRTRIFELAEKYGIAGDCVALCKAIENATERHYGKRINANVDGAIAAVQADMGFDWRYGRAFFFVPRAVGLTAHAIEQVTREPPWRHVSPDEMTYDGPDKRKLHEK